MRSNSTNLDLISQHIGGYAHSEDFAFAEAVRSTDVQIKEILPVGEGRAKI